MGDPSYIPRPRQPNDSLQKLADELIPREPKEVPEPVRNRVEFTSKDIFIHVECNNKKEARKFSEAWNALIEFLPDD